MDEGTRRRIIPQPRPPDIFHTIVGYFSRHELPRLNYTKSKSRPPHFEYIMKKLDDNKVSWVEFLRSIKFAQHNMSNERTKCPTHFADFNPQARTGQQSNAEDSHLVRSAN